MGWTSYQDNPELSRAEMIRREFTQQPTEKNPHAFGFEFITERGATVYAIMWHDAPETPRKYFGIVFLTTRRTTDRWGREFSYKDIEETCGPHYYDAPLKMIDQLDTLAPNPAGYAAGWREAVRQHHAHKREKAKARRAALARFAQFIPAQFKAAA